MLTLTFPESVTLKPSGPARAPKSRLTGNIWLGGVPYIVTAYAVDYTGAPGIPDAKLQIAQVEDYETELEEFYRAGGDIREFLAFVWDDTEYVVFIYPEPAPECDEETDG